MQAITDLVSDDKRQWVTNTLILALVSQSIFWFALGFAESKGRPAGFDEPDTIKTWWADEDGARLPGLEPFEVPRIAEPGYKIRDPERHPHALFEFDFEGSSTSTESGVMLGYDRRIVEVRLNDQPLKTQTPVDIWGILAGHDPVVYSFPHEYLVEGQNRLEFLASGRSLKIMPYFFVGELSDLYAANTWLRMFSIDLVVVAIGVLLFAIVLNLVTHWPPQEQLRIRSLNLLLGAWTIRNLTFLGIDGSFPDPFRLWFHFIVTYFFLFSFLAFALGWTRRPLRSMIVPALGFGICVVATGIAAAISEQTLFDTGFVIEISVTLAVGAAVLLLFSEFWTRNGRNETTEILLFLVCMGAIVADAVDDFFQISVPFVDIPLTFYAAPMCGLLLALGMVASLAAQSTRARVATENVNLLLRTKLKQQEERLNESHEREKQIEKQQVLVDERQRIIRDMHDGVGGSIMSLLLRARRNELSNENLVRSLSASMNELRLIIDSFDHVGDNLEFAIGVFRQRVEPELADSGVQLHYETSAADAIEGFGPESVLQIYRILQEICNNAVNHGNAKNIFIELNADPVSRQICIAVADDGAGFDADSVTHGRGLKNLEYRAAALAGTFNIERNVDARGMRAVLVFPMR